MNRLVMAAGLGVVLCPGVIFAGDAVSEDELFSAPELVTQAVSSPTAAGSEEKKTLGFSGEIVSVMQDAVYSSSPADPLNSFITGNLFLDARLKNGVKAFANLETSHYPRVRQTTSTLREVFLDFNLDRRIYFRTGKQVLQWGRCYMWNPTDLVNVEKKPFVPKIGSREGAYGVKFHIPFGTDYNIYGFLDTGNAAADRDIAGALKFELLAGRTEMAFSGWARRNRRPVVGYDISSRLGDVDIAGEVSASHRGNGFVMRDEGGVLSVAHDDRKWATKAAIDLSKGFRLGNFNNRLTVTTEIFYNKAGYARNPFRDKTLRTYSGPLSSVVPAGTKGLFLLGNGLYEPNYLSRYYGAAFVTVTRFIVTDMMLNLNYIRNLCDDSGMLSAGVAYKTLNDFSTGFLVSSFLGPRYGEYTFSGAKLAAQLTFGVSF